MAKKYYAVKAGNETGIFYDWDSCKTAINGFRNAQYRGFNRLEDAEAYMKSEELPTEAKIKSGVGKPVFENEVQIFTGNIVANGDTHLGLVLRAALKDFKYFGKLDNILSPNCKSYAGELLGVLLGVEIACALRLTNISVYYKNDGVFKWYNSDWRAKSDIAYNYARTMNILEDEYCLNIQFFKLGTDYESDVPKTAKRLADRSLVCGKLMSLSGILGGTFGIENVLSIEEF